MHFPPQVSMDRGRGGGLPEPGRGRNNLGGAAAAAGGRGRGPAGRGRGRQRQFAPLSGAVRRHDEVEGPPGPEDLMANFPPSIRRIIQQLTQPGAAADSTVDSDKLMLAGLHVLQDACSRLGVMNNTLNELLSVAKQVRT